MRSKQNAVLKLASLETMNLVMDATSSSVAHLHTDNEKGHTYYFSRNSS